MTTRDEFRMSDSDSFGSLHECEILKLLIRFEKSIQQRCVALLFSENKKKKINFKCA